MGNPEGFSVKREDFVFTIGFDGAAAVVDGEMRRRHGGSAIGELLAAGLYRPAACAALWDDDEAAVQQVVEAFNRASGSKLQGRVDLVRLLGVPLQVLKGDAASESVTVKVQVI